MTVDMFGLLLAGRLVDTSFCEVDPTHVLITVPNVESSNHLVVFLTGSRPFPDGMGGAVYFSWPDSTTPVPSWQYLGGISNAKPSAIFKIAKFKVIQESQNAGESCCYIKVIDCVLGGVILFPFTHLQRIVSRFISSMN